MNETEKKDLQGYAFIRGQIMHVGTTPSLRQIADAVGYESRHSAKKLLGRLVSRGLIRISKDGIHLPARQPIASHERTTEVPLVGSVSCGLPTLAEQNVEATIDISTKFAKPGHVYFLLRAKGTSMNKSGINPGDLILVRQQPTAEEGDKVVALINDDATIKHFHREEDIIVLRPNSTVKMHKPIVLSDEFLIQGVVAAVFPKNTY
jgi:repressor LexA